MDRICKADQNKDSDVAGSPYSYHDVNIRSVLYKSEDSLLGGSMTSDVIYSGDIAQPSRDAERSSSGTLADPKQVLTYIVLRAYKATPVRDLETEIYIPPLDLYLDERKAAYSKRIKET